MCTSDVKKAKDAGRGERKSTKGKQRPEYKRRVKPPYSYVELITMAIKSSPTQMKTLREILDYMQAKFQCFRGSYVGWKNSVRHNLSAAECFTKVLRNKERPFGKDNYWTMNLDCSHCFNMKSGASAQRRKGSSSVPSTPRSVSTSSDHGYQDGHTVQDWVANQATIIRVPSSSSSSEPQVQYIELCHTNRDGQSRGKISTFDFESSINRLEPSTYCRAPSSSSDSWTYHSSR